MKKSRKNIFNYLLLLLVLTFSISSCSTKKPYDWVILVYMAADNSLYTNAVSDINEMEKAQFDEDKIKVIVLSDLLQLPGEDRLYEDSRIFDIHHDDDPSKVTSPTFEYKGELNTGDYNTLTDFANWAYKKYPALKHALFIWSHGNGWYPYTDKFCIDHSSSDFFNIPNGDLKKALDNISVNIDIFGLDACNMQTLEVIDEIGDNATFIVSSEYEIQSDGFPYDDILTHWNNYTLPKNISIQVADDFFKSYMPGGSQNIYGNTYFLSASDVDNFYYYRFISALQTFLSMDLSEIKTQIKAARDMATTFIDMDYSSQIDVYEFFKNLRGQIEDTSNFATPIDNILSELNKIFLYHDNFMIAPRVGYATVWFPDNYETYQNMLPDYSKLSFYQIGWDKIIQAYFSSDVDKKSKGKLAKN